MSRINRCYYFQKILSLLLVFTCVLMMQPVPAKAATDIQYCVNLRVCVDGVDIGEIPAVEDNYESNLYVSLKGVAYALQGTEKAFSPTIEKRKISIARTGGGDAVSGTGAAPGSVDVASGTGDAPDAGNPAGIPAPPVWNREDRDTALYTYAARNELYLDGEERKYYSFILACGGEYDAFLTPISLAMMFDMDIEVTKGRVDIHPSRPFSVTAEELEASGYLQGVNSLLIGDGTTGEVFYEYDGGEVVPIASTTKLITYFILMDAVSDGECSLEDSVLISEKAAKLSVSPDGMTPMTAGSRASMKDLIYGMLLLSSNECALAIAEHVAGDEEAFVARMNEKAGELRLAETEFYNCHGLPYFDDQLIPAKVQNHMTAEEMFRFAAVLLETYPQVTDITSTKSCHLDTLGMYARNSNGILYNLEQAVGLKTGTTNKAGACLVTCAAVEKEGKTHYLITVLFGAEGDVNRTTVSEIALRHGIHVLQERDETEKKDHHAGNNTVIPDDPELVIQRLIRCAHSRS